MVDSTSVEQKAARFKALGEPTRLRILDLLADGPTCVCTLREQTGLSGPLMSHHLGILRSAGLVTAARRGRWVDYEITEGALEQLGASLLGTAAGTRS